MTPPEGLWEDICKQMDMPAEPVSASHKRWYWAVAAAVLALVGFFAVYLYEDHSEPSVLTAKSEMKPIESKENTEIESKTEPKTEPKAEAPQKAKSSIKATPSTTLITFSTQKDEEAKAEITIEPEEPTETEVLAESGVQSEPEIQSDSVASVEEEKPQTSKPTKKEKTALLIDYEKGQLEKLGVEIRLNTEATVEAIKELKPYAVFVATGSTPVMPKSIKGLDGKNVHTPVEILDGTVKLSNKKVCVVGSGMTGIETAELLSEQGNDVTVFEMADDIGPGLFFQNLVDVMSRIAPKNVAMYPKHRLVEIDGNKVAFETTDTKEAVSFEFDEVVVSLGVAANKAANEEIAAAFDNVRFLGDALATGRIAAAVKTGYLAAAEL